jgi:hypothetical protein
MVETLMIVFAWSGWGILSLVFLVGATLPGFVWPGPYSVVGGPFFAAVLNGFVGYTLNRPLRLSPAAAGRRHSLFLIPMEWWSVPMAGFGCYLLALYLEII